MQVDQIKIVVNLSRSSPVPADVDIVAAIDVIDCMARWPAPNVHVARQISTNNTQ